MNEYSDYEVTISTTTVKRVYAKSAFEAFEFANNDNVQTPSVTIVTEVHIALAAEE